MHQRKRKLSMIRISLTKPSPNTVPKGESGRLQNEKCSGQYRWRSCHGARLLLALPILASVFSVALITPATADSERQTFVRINQLGYRPLDPKSAVAFSRAVLPQRFTVIDAGTQQVVFE